MKFVVLNGSPKGDISVTMGYIRLIEANFKQNEFKYINVAQLISKIEKDSQLFDSIIEEIKNCDGVIWAFPLYVFTAHSNYQRFIDLVFERGVQPAFAGKYTFALTTSIHFYDHTATNYINAVCDDLDMVFVDYFSPKMYDVENQMTRQNLINFMQHFIDCIKDKVTFSKNYSQVKYIPVDYTPLQTKCKIDSKNKNIVILAEHLENKNVKDMVYKFKDCFTQNVELLTIADFGIRGGCLGCMKCGYNYSCVYEGKDDYTKVYNEKLKTADIIIFAGTIKNRYLSSDFKRFLDRAFFNTHTPSLSGKQIGFILSGALSQNANLRQIFDAFVQWQQSNLVAFITDEVQTIELLDSQLEALAQNAVKLSNINYIKPANFLGVAGAKIFRDDIYGDIRFPFVADYKAYKASGTFDFPHKKYISRIRNSIFALMVKIPSFRKEIYNNQIIPSMVQPFQKYIDKK